MNTINSLFSAITRCNMFTELIPWHQLSHLADYQTQMMKAIPCVSAWVSCQGIDTLSSEPYGCHFANDKFKRIFLNAVWLSLKVLMTTSHYWMRYRLDAGKATSHYLINGNQSLRHHMVSLSHNGFILLAPVAMICDVVVNSFYPRPVLAFGYCRRLCLCVCVCVSIACLSAR